MGRRQAAVFRASNGWRLRYYDSQDKRRSMFLGQMTAAQAGQWGRHVSHLMHSWEASEPPAKATVSWIARLPLRERAKLERAGLIEPNEASKERKRQRDNAPPDRLGPFLDWYLTNRTANKPRTLIKWQQGARSLTRYFKANRRLDSITCADAECWRNWLAKSGSLEGDGKLAEATVRRRTGQARQFFHYAIKAKLLEDNPFDGLSANVQSNSERKFFVTRDMAQRMIEHAPGAEWEAIIALARFGGLRAPSDILRLKWEDVDFANRRLTVHSSKTEHHANKGIRFCPIFPELLPYLESLADLARHRGAKPDDYVITSPRGSESVLRKPFLSILKRAGIPVYPKPFQNLRASRETELMDEFPIKDVCSWLGNSPRVAMEHYAMTRQDSFARAAGLVHHNSGPESGPDNGSFRHLPAVPDSGREDAETSFDQQKQGKSPLLATAGSCGQNPLNRPGRT